MKFAKWYLLVFALALTMVASGCRKPAPVHLKVTGMGASEVSPKSPAPSTQDADMSWADEAIVATGYGRPPKNASNPAQRRPMARRAAKLDALRKLAEQAQLDEAGLASKKDLDMMDYEKGNEVVKKIEGYLVGAEVVNERELKDGAYEVRMRMNLRQFFKRLPENKAESVRTRLMAERAAKLDGYRQLLESLKGIQITSTTTVEDFMAKDDRIRSRVEGIVRDARVVDRRFNSDGTVEVDMLLEHPDINQVVR